MRARACSHRPPVNAFLSKHQSNINLALIFWNSPTIWAILPNRFRLGWVDCWGLSLSCYTFLILYVFVVDIVINNHQCYNAAMTKVVEKTHLNIFACQTNFQAPESRLHQFNESHCSNQTYWTLCLCSQVLLNCNMNHMSDGMCLFSINVSLNVHSNYFTNECSHSESFVFSVNFHNNQVEVSYDIPLRYYLPHWTICLTYIKRLLNLSENDTSKFNRRLISLVKRFWHARLEWKGDMCCSCVMFMRTFLKVP